jgi:chorismate dehydratase
MYRLGIPSYANTAPLFRFLAEQGELSFKFGVPSQLNRWLQEGEVDLSLVSAAFVLEQPGSFRILPDFSVSVLGRVYSVNLFHTRPLAELRRVALTTESRTSVVLLRRLLELRGVFPEFVTTTGGLELLEKFDALLLIGDRAIQAYAQGFSGPVPPVRNWPERVGSIQVTDLAQLWWEQTGLPFVFAVWATREGEPPAAEVLAALRAARQAGIASLGGVAFYEATRLGVPYPLMLHYLWNFRYHLEAPDRAGLAEFAKVLGLAGEIPYWEV